MKIVALEEHFATAEVMRGWKSVDPRWSDLALKLSTEGEGARGDCWILEPSASIP